MAKSKWEKEAEQALIKLEEARKALSRVCLYDSSNAIEAITHLTRCEIKNELQMFAFHSKSRKSKK